MNKDVVVGAVPMQLDTKLNSSLADLIHKKRPPRRPNAAKKNGQTPRPGIKLGPKQKQFSKKPLADSKVQNRQARQDKFQRNRQLGNAGSSKTAAARPEDVVIQIANQRAPTKQKPRMPAVSAPVVPKPQQNSMQMSLFNPVVPNVASVSITCGRK